MKNLSIIAFLILLGAIRVAAQIPIVYYDFENNGARGNFQNAVEMSVNTPPAGSVFTYVASAGACNTIECSNAQGRQGAGETHGGSATGTPITVGAWQQVVADPGTSAASYFQFVVNTAGFSGIRLTFDAKFGNGNAPTSVGVLISSNGTSWTFVGSTNTTNGNTIPVPSGVHTWGTGDFNLTAASSIANNNGTLYIRVYGYGASGGGNGTYLSLDNVTILATSTVAGKVFTTLDENNYYTGYTSGLTGTTLGRGGFTATGAGTNVTINPTSGLKLNSGQTFSVAATGTVTFGSAGKLSGTGGIFNIASGATLTTANSGGVSGSITTTGTNVYTSGANYTFNAITTTPFPTGSFGNPGNVIINPGVGNAVTLNISPTISGNLSFSSGRLAVGNNTLTLNGTVSGMSATNVIRGGATSNMVIGGTGALGTLFFDQATPGTTNSFATFTLNRTASGIATLGNALSVGSGGLNLTNGTLADGGNIITLAGNITGTGAHGGSGKITMVASGSTISSVSLGNLELNNAGGFSLSGSPSVGGTLTLAAGKLTLGSNNLILGLASAISGTPSAAAMIVANGTGQVRKLFSSNASFLFPIGDNTNYTPITLNFTSGSYAVGAYCAVNVKTVKHPNNANTTDYLNRYWPVVTSGITSPVYSVSSAKYVLADVVGSDGNMSMGQYTGALPWIKFGVANTGTQTISSASVTSISSDFTGITTAPPVVTSSANTAICSGGSTVLTASGESGDPVFSYTWSPATGLSATTGTSVTASPSGTTTYTLTISDGNGFAGTATTTVSVNPIPPITGNTSLCIGLTNTLNNASSGGTWVSSDVTKATIDLNSGEATGQAAGTSTITYTASPGCVVTTEVTVQPLPDAITGSASVCIGNMTSLGHPVSGGTWVSGAIGTATVSATGEVTGLTSGTAAITYTLPSGCIIKKDVTVQPIPAAITGVLSVCIGLNTTLSHSDGGGTWASSATGIASVNSSGVVTGNMQGTATITYTVPAGCITTIEVTVNPLPAAIAGPSVVCEEATITLANADAGGSWMSIPVTAATISTTGVVTGVAAGNATIIYTLPTGCSTSKTLTVNATPDVVTGSSEVCIGQTIVLANTTSGGTWSSDAVPVASVDVTGTVTGETEGTANISYTLSNSCFRLKPVTVNALPAAITGTMNVCVNSATTLATTSTGGTWSSPDANVSVGAATGIVTGISDGTATISYTSPVGCNSMATVTVDPLPEAITGINEVCVNGVTSLFNMTAGGTWSSELPAIATVSGTGEVLGMSEGVTDIIYTLPTGCASVTELTVNPLPAAFTGSMQVCQGLTTILNSASTGGIWSSGDDSRATVDASGIVTGVSPGNVFISYTIATGCTRSEQITVNPLPAAISGDMEVCMGSTTTYTNSSVGGTWLCACVAPGLAIDGGGVFTAGSVGTTTITYMLPTGCQAIAELTVNPLPAAITGVVEVCEGLSVTLSSTDAGGVWSSMDLTAGVNASTGEVSGISAGIATITYTLPATGCYTTTQVTVHALPTTITGSLQVCDGLSTVLASTPAGGTWESSDPGVVTVSAGGVALGEAEGNANITYTSPAGCIRVTTFTVNPLPAAITGMLPVCVSSQATLHNATAGGTWSSNATGIATINTMGLIEGVAEGNTTISYTLGTGCYSTATATVNALPEGITGVAAVCRGLSTTLSSITAGGVWSSNSDVIATVNAVGEVTGESDGITTISYTLATSCYVTRTVTVNALPSAITGNAEVCFGLTSPLGSLPTGGTWSSNDGGVADVNISTGEVAGVSVGTADITYTLPTGCLMATTVTVNPLPATITGIAEVCEGGSSTLSNADAGTWSSETTSIADIDAAGLVSAFASGITTITFTLPTGCIATKEFTVNALPSPFTGTQHVCEGLTTTIGNSLTGGTWVSSDDAIADIDLTSGLVTGYVAGTVDITYTLATGCQRTEVFTVHPALPTITGTATVCQGLTTPLANSATGGIWLSENTLVANIEPVSGLVTGVGAGTSRISYSLPTGCRVTTIVTVDPLPASITGAASVCAGLSIALGNTTAGGSWSSGSPAIGTVDMTGVVNGISAGTVSITYTLPTGCIQSKEITVNALPVAQSVTGGGSYCFGGTGVVVGLGGTEPSVSYTLYRGTTVLATISGTGLPLDFGTYAIAGTYSVKATNGSTGCIDNMTGSAVVAITPLITPSVSFVSGMGDTLCGGTVTTFTATPVNGGTSPVYEWLVNDIVVGTGSTYVYSPAHGDSVKVKLTSSEACPSPAIVMAKKRMNVIANQMPTISIDKTSSDSVCQFALAWFEAAATWTGDAPVYSWRRNGVEVATGTGFSYIPADGDVITCRLTSNYRCRLANTVTSSGITLDVDSAYIPSVTVVAEPGLTIAPLTTATLTASVTGAGTAPVYQWKVNGLLQPLATGPVYTSKFNDNDVVTCIVYGTGPCGLPSFNMVTMTVREGVEVAAVVGSRADLKMMPNPNNGQFIISGTLGTMVDAPVSIQVTDMLGQVVYNNAVTARSGSLNERIQLNNGLANGMYMLRVGTGAECKVIHFVVKQ